MLSIIMIIICQFGALVSEDGVGTNAWQNGALRFSLRLLDARISSSSTSSVLWVTQVGVRFGR